MTQPNGNQPVKLDPGYSAEIAKAIRERQPRIRRSETVELTGELAHSHALVELRIDNAERTHRVSIDVCVETEPNDIDSPIVARDVALNYLEAILGDYFDNERTLTVLPAWDLHVVEEIKIKVRGEITNPVAEAAADKFLAEHGFGPDGTATGGLPKIH